MISLKDPGGDDTFPSTSITGDPACLKHADVHGFNALPRTCDKHRGAQHPYYGCGRSLTHRSRSLNAVGHIGAGGGGGGGQFHCFTAPGSSRSPILLGL